MRSLSYDFGPLCIDDTVGSLSHRQAAPLLLSHSDPIDISYWSFVL